MTATPAEPAQPTTTLDVHVLRVFTDPQDAHGNELGVVFNAADLPGELGVRLTAHLGFSETVFVDDEPKAVYRIFTPARELKLAGHPTVGFAWALASRAADRCVPPVLRPRLAAEVAAWRAPEDEAVWIRGALADAPDWQFVRLAEPAQVEALPVDATDQRSHHQFWAWIDEAAGLVRARTFGTDVGVPEDEATGSAALRLCVQLGRPITIRQGRGSVIQARPATDAGWAEIGGHVAADGVRTVTF
ncbi:MAG: PhzF family phenazine biosynthesis protein [Actinocrinis sp.]